MNTFFLGIFTMLVLSSFVSGSDSEFELEDNTKTIVEDYGCASDCAQEVRGAVLTLAANNMHNPNEGNSYINLYLDIYGICFSSNCQ